MEIIIFGTGSSAENFFLSLDIDKVRIIGFCDNDVSKHHNLYNGYQVIPPKDILLYPSAYIFIASQYSDEIMKQLLRMGVPYSKIVPTDHENHYKKIAKVYKDIHQSIVKDKDYSRRRLKIGVTNYNYSNYNGYALIKYMPSFISDKYNVDLIVSKDNNELAKYDVICSSLYEGIYDGKHINIEMWHGFPIKRIGVMDPLNVNDSFLSYVERSTKHTNLVLSYSQLYTTLFNSSFPSDISKYRITGIPRNDLLFEKGGLNKLEKIVNKKLNDYNIVFYLPTWRKGKNPKRVDSSREWDQLFGFEDEKVSRIIDMLEESKLFLVVKLHPYEFNLYKDLEIFKHEQIYLISEEELIHHEIHLYELLTASSFIITDYSSIFFDTLLIDLPIIFAPTDLGEYKQNKGFLMEPYEYFTPGKTVKSLKDLHQEIMLLLSGVDPYKEQRKIIKELVFKYFDNQSTVRAWHAIDDYLETLKS